MKPTRPFRAYSVYAAPCVDCGDEVESVAMPIPNRCLSCQSKWEAKNLRDKPNAVRSTTGAAS